MKRNVMCDICEKQFDKSDVSVIKGDIVCWICLAASKKHE